MAAKNKVRGSVSNLEQATTSVNERILKVCQKRDYFYFFSSQFVLKLAVKMLLAQSLHQYPPLNSFIIFLFIQHALALLFTYQTLRHLQPPPPQFSNIGESYAGPLSLAHVKAVLWIRIRNRWIRIRNRWIRD
jgi:hypothetical protein